MEFTVSLDIYLLTLTDDETAEFDRAIVERAFKAIAVDQLGGNGIGRRRRDNDFCDDLRC